MLDRAFQESQKIIVVHGRALDSFASLVPQVLSHSWNTFTAIFTVGER